MTTTAVQRHVTGLQGQLTDREFGQFRALMYPGRDQPVRRQEAAGGRAAGPPAAPAGSGRLRQLPPAGAGRRRERQIAVDLLTTNETYFFREPKHFDFLRSHALPELKGQSTVRVWSGACSSGEEPYTIAMVMAEVLGGARGDRRVGHPPACWPTRGRGVTRWTTRRAFPGRCWRSTASRASGARTAPS
jgi:hypothetical protein